MRMMRFPLSGEASLRVWPASVSLHAQALIKSVSESYPRIQHAPLACFTISTCIVFLQGC